MSHAGPPGALTCLPVDGIGEVRPGDDLAGILAGAVDLRDGDIVALTSKVVSKAEGRVRPGTREQSLPDETDRVLARRGGTSIVRTHHGLVLAAAGIDASNTAPGSVVLLPRDPDASARALRERLAGLTGRNVAVLVTDTAGRAWRNGQTDIAIGAAGLDVVEDHAGRLDPHGNELAVTAPAVADELASAADLVKRKLDRRPAAVVRGLAALVLAPGAHGPGAAALVRPEGQDKLGLGAREAVLGALRGEDARGFGAPCPAGELVERLASVAGPAAVLRLEDPDAAPGEGEGPAVTAALAGDDWDRGVADARLRTAAHALGWHPVGPGEGRTLLRFRPATP